MEPAVSPTGTEGGAVTAREARGAGRSRDLQNGPRRSWSTLSSTRETGPRCDRGNEPAGRATAAWAFGHLRRLRPTRWAGRSPKAPRHTAEAVGGQRPLSGISAAWSGGGGDPALPRAPRGRANPPPEPPLPATLCFRTVPNKSSQNAPPAKTLDLPVTPPPYDRPAPNRSQDMGEPEC